MVGTNVSLEGLMFPKCLVARGKFGASESVVALVCLYMSFKPRVCQEALRTSFPVARIRPLMGM